MAKMTADELVSFKTMVVALVEVLIRRLEQHGMDTHDAYALFIGEMLPVAAGLHILHHGSDDFFLRMAKKSLELAREDFAMWPQARVQ
jgi:hypothetical protein